MPEVHLLLLGLLLLMSLLTKTLYRVQPQTVYIIDVEVVMPHFGFVVLEPRVCILAVDILSFWSQK